MVSIYVFVLCFYNYPIGLSKFLLNITLSITEPCHINAKMLGCRLGGRNVIETELTLHWLLIWLTLF